MHTLYFSSKIMKTCTFVFSIFVIFLFYACDVADSTEELAQNNNGDAGGDTPGEYETGEKIIDKTCGTHVGDSEIFDIAPELIPMTPDNVIGDGSQPDFIHLSWQSEPSISMSFTWRTNDSSKQNMTKSTIVRVSKNEDMSDAIEINNENKGEMVGSVAYLPYHEEYKTIHIAEVCGLEPGTDYYYEVGGVDEDGEPYFSDTYSFKTAPDPRLEQDKYKFRFVVMGDSRTNYDIWGEVIKACAAEKPDFIINVGDNVDWGNAQDEWNIWFEKAEPYLRTIPMFMIHGNHEFNHINYYAQFAMPGNEQWFSFNYANLNFTILNDTTLGKLGKLLSTSNEQKLFLEQALSSTSRIWKMVGHHIPQWSASKHGCAEGIRGSWGPIIDQYGVQLVYAGHDHQYERTVPLYDEKTVADPKEGTTYIVTGGAGAPLYDSGNEWWTVYSTKSTNYVVVNIDGKKITLEAKTVDRQVFDYLSYTID